MAGSRRGWEGPVLEPVNYVGDNFSGTSHSRRETILTRQLMWGGVMAKTPVLAHRVGAVLSSHLFFTACATGPEVPSVAELLGKNTGQDGGACMQTSELRRYSVADDEFIFIDGSLGYYIVTLNPGCQDLGTTPGMALDGSFNEVCGLGMDKVITRGHQCFIREIFKFDNRDAAFAAYQAAAEQQAALVKQAESEQPPSD